MTDKYPRASTPGGSYSGSFTISGEEVAEKLKQSIAATGDATLTIGGDDSDSGDDTDADADEPARADGGPGYLGVPACPECGEQDAVQLAGNDAPWVCQNTDCREVFTGDE